MHILDMNCELVELCGNIKNDDDYQKVVSLLKQGANPNYKFEVPSINEAALNGYLKVVKILIKYGADINILDIDGFNPVLYSCLGDNKKVFKYLIKLGAIINIKNESDETIQYAEFGKRLIYKRLKIN